MCGCENVDIVGFLLWLPILFMFIFFVKAITFMFDKQCKNPTLKEIKKDFGDKK